MRSQTRFPLIVGALALALFLMAGPQQAFAQANCESPNLLMILDRSCSMAFTTNSSCANNDCMTTSSKTCNNNNQCTPMPRTYQPSPGTTPRYTRTCSSGRCRYTRWDTAVNTIKEITYRYGGTAAQNYANRRIRFGLEYFSSANSSDTRIAAGIVSNPPTIASSLNGTNANGGTYYRNAFTVARAHLQSVVNADTVKKRPTHILFITDGAPSEDCSLAEAVVRDLFQGTGANRLVDNQNNVYNVKTYVIGFGTGINSTGQACLNRLAAAGGTQRCNTSLPGCVAYYAADSQTQLDAAMTGIINNATQEVCDGLDNDCNGQTDEGLTRNCVTACGTGTETCNNGTWGACSSGVPSAEQCNGQDDDCDGQVDENFPTKGNPCAVGVGECRRTGTNVCRSDGSGVQCSVSPGSPSAELCDGKDNDCDGSVDENFPSKGQACNVGTGACRRSGNIICNSAGTGVTCSANPGNPTPELCDGIDNDCDGGVDENWPQKGSSCTVGQGICARNGSWVCNAAKTGVQCSATPGTPQAEICDGKDNDCDGQTDEGCQCINGQTQTCFSGSQGCTKTGPTSYNCQAPCKTGTQTCVTGRWGTCVGQITAQPEKCNGLDDDCDGQVDETFPTKGQACSVGVGACKRNGTWRCRTNQTGLECSATAGTAGTETCNGQDDDCDGDVDENLSRNCSTPCESGTETCNNGNWVNCSARKPVAETCNGKDDDCDGQTDENWANLNQNCKVGVGVCERSGKWRCKNDGTGVECSAQPGPSSKEICDGKDNDCDGQTDEDFPTKGDPCTSGDGICKKSGTLVCLPDGSGVQCSAVAGNPQPETCDGIDNDCDGKTDEELLRPCKTACESGTESCTNGQWGGCTARKPEPEVCDNKDNNCDGKVDEGVTEPCKTICGSGTATCVAGRFVNCDAQKPEPEICDGKDNDCNGKVDELPDKQCSGLCGKGIAKCVGGKWTGCSGPQPENEICDGKDNDCDGRIDNGVTRPCKGKCGDGRELCSNGQWINCSAPAPQPEICDGKDNDCDGKADNDAKCPAGTVCEEGKCKRKCRNGECPGGSSCVDDYCVGDLCKKIECPSGRECIAGSCVGPCDLVTCPSKHVCDKGKCVKDDCYRNGCPGSKICVRGECQDDPCANAQCTGDQFCRDGRCIDSCANVTCKDDERCEGGRCVPDPKKSGPCKDVKCPDGEHCEQGKCITDPCKDVQCPSGRVCVSGVCDHDVCGNIKCPTGETCREGNCFKDPNYDPEKHGSEQGNGKDGGTTNPGDKGGTPGDNGGTPGNDKGGTPGDNGSQSDDPLGSGDKTGGQQHGSDTPGGQRYAPGCACSSQSNAPLTPFLMIGLFLAIFGLRRRS